MTAPPGSLARSQVRRRVLVCHGVTCTGFLAADVFRALRKGVDGAGLHGCVTVERAGCFARCGGGVTVVVRDEQEAAQAEVPLDPFAWPAPLEIEAERGAVYPEVSAPMVARIIEEHLCAGEPVAAMLVATRGAKAPPTR